MGTTYRRLLPERSPRAAGGRGDRTHSKCLPGSRCDRGRESSLLAPNRDLRPRTRWCCRSVVASRRSKTKLILVKRPLGTPVGTSRAPFFQNNEISAQVPGPFPRVGVFRVRPERSHDNLRNGVATPNAEDRLRPIDYLYRGLTQGPGAVAIAGPGAPVTYRELVAVVEALAAAFQSFDATPGSRVGICARNTPEHLIALLATYAAGKVWVPLNSRNGRTELDAMISVTKPTILITDESCSDRFSPTTARLVMAKPELASLVDEFRGRNPAPVERGPEDAQIIKFSGGSTGSPKAVVQSLRCVDRKSTRLNSS